MRTSAGLVAGELLAPHRQQLVAGALEQPRVQVELGGEVVVDHGRRHAGAAGDLVDRRAAVAALGEHLRGRPLDHLAALGRGEAPALCSG